MKAQNHGRETLVNTGRNVTSTIQSMVRAFICFIVLAIALSNFASAVNNPGHDSLYILRGGDNVSGTFNISGTAILPSTTTIGSQNVCLADGTNCIAVGGASSGGGWSNTSTTTSTVLDVNVGSGKLFVNSSSGNVGIGTTGPSAKLELKDSAGPSIYGIRTTNRFGFSVDNDDVDIGARDAGNVHIMTGAGARVATFLSNGNVGIGTTGPTANLEVKGSSTTGNVTISSGDTTLLGTDVLGGLNFKSYDADAHVGGDQDLGYMRGIIVHEAGGTGVIDGSADEGFELAFTTSKRPSPNALFTLTEAMRINKNGNVGIGTTAPDTLLHIYKAGATVQSKVEGTTDVSFSAKSTAVDSYSFLTLINDARQWTLMNDGALSDIFKIRDSTAGQDRLVINSDGNVGIGDVSPDVLLSVGSNSLAKTAIGSSVIKVGGRITASDVQEIGFGGDDSTATPMSAIGNIVISGDSYAKGALYFATRDVTTNTAPSERMRITNDGNVGIGTTNPSQKLEVNGGVRLNTTTSKPSCDSTVRGTFWFEQSASGTDDYMFACMKNAANSYNWVLVARGS